MGFARIKEIGLDRDNRETPVGVTGQFKHRFNTFEYQNFYPTDLEEIDIIGLDDTLTQNRTITAMRYNNVFFLKNCHEV